MTIVAINIQVRSVILLYLGECVHPMLGDRRTEWNTYQTTVMEKIFDNGNGIKGDRKHISQGRWKLL